MHKYFLIFAVTFTLTFTHLQAAPNPNIILFMADDMGMGDTSSYQSFTGNTDDQQIHTPQMQRLAEMGMRFTDAHTPGSRCTLTRYGLLTGRYSWRNRMKHFVLFSAQGDPMIEADRPTLASLLKDHGYGTAITGKWHVGIRYRQSDGKPASGWKDADLKQPIHTTPLDHGFDYVRITSRSHGTSGPNAGKSVLKKRKKKGSAPSHDASKENPIGPGHIEGRTIIGATNSGKTLIKTGRAAYVLKDLGERHSDHAMAFLTQHISSPGSKIKPFFLYYPANSNHTPYTPSSAIGGVPITGMGKTISGKPLGKRGDYIYENDVALGRFLNWLETTDDPRNPGRKLKHNTIVIFTSDNGSENKAKWATGPLKSNKGSCYEGGHRVPFLIAWPSGGIKPGTTAHAPINLQDLYATFTEIIGGKMPDYLNGQKGGEDSHSILPALKDHSNSLQGRPPAFYNDHKEAKSDPAVNALRLDSPKINGKAYPGKWKIFFDGSLSRFGTANPTALYNLATDQMEASNLIEDSSLKPLIDHLMMAALRHRNSGGHRLVPLTSDDTTTFDFLSRAIQAQLNSEIGAGIYQDEKSGLTMSLKSGDDSAMIKVSESGLGMGANACIDQGESLTLSFDRDVLIESIAIKAGDGSCGGYYRVGNKAPLAIYCIDADNDYKDQHGILSDIGVLKKGELLLLDSSSHFGVEPAGKWTIQNVKVRTMKVE